MMMYTMAAKMEGHAHQAPGVAVTGRKERRASLVIAETAAQLAGLAKDADRSNALMAELEALLSASQVASGSTGPGTVFASAHFTATQPLELSSDDDDGSCEDMGVYNDGSGVEDLSSQRLNTMRCVGRTGSVITVGGHVEGPLLITGTSASFSARPGFAPSPFATTAAASGGAGGSPTPADRRASISFSNMRLGTSFTAGRGGGNRPSQSGGFRASTANAAQPVGGGSGAQPMGAAPRGLTSSGYGDGLRQEPSSPRFHAPTERRSSFIAWAVTRSPSRRSSRTAETPPASAAVAAAAGAGNYRAPSAHRRSSACEGPSSPPVAAAAVSASPSRVAQMVRRASSTSHVSFLPRLGRRESDTSGAPLYGSNGSNGGTISGGGGAAARLRALIGGTRSSRTLKD